MIAATAADYVAKNWDGAAPALERCTSAEETNCWSWPYEHDMYGVNASYDEDPYHLVQARLKGP